MTLKQKGNIEITSGSLFIDGVEVGGGGAGIGGSSYIFVSAAGTEADNATELQAAYNTAKTMSPAATNRVTVIAAPGLYNFGATAFVMDTPFIDLVSLDGNRSIAFNAPPYLDGDFNNGPGIRVVADNISVNGLNLQGKAFGIVTGLISLNVKNCVGGTYSFGFGLASVPGTFTDCEAGNNSFGSYSNVSGTFVGCKSGSFSFGYGGSTTSGRFYNCESDSSSFGGGAGGSTTSGTFVSCKGTTSCFGLSGTISGQFEGCSAAAQSFGSTGVASGTFKGCTGGSSSFGGYVGAGTLTGKLYYCQLTADVFNTVSGAGRTYYCVDGNGDVNNQ